jgi:MoaA/NifB/PqqE/SkfB family radical SAM enzyme
MAVVTTAGDVVPCCSLFDSMGNLREKSFEEIWRGERYRDLRCAILSPNPHRLCITCTARGWRGEDWAREARQALNLLSVPARRAFRGNPVLRRIKPALKKIIRIGA